MTVSDSAPDNRHWWSPAPGEPGEPIAAGRAYVEVLAVFLAFFGAGIVAAVIDVTGHRSATTSAGWADLAPGMVATVASTALAVAVVVLLGQRRHRSAADLGLAVKGKITLSQGIRVAAWATLGLIAGSIVTSALASSGFPFGPSNYPELVYGLFSSVKAGFVEETVVLGFVVVTLTQARRPRGEIVAIALLLRMSYHVYYGPGAVGILVWAGIFLWLFLRTRSLVPLIVVHVLWDGLAFLIHQWHGVAAVEGLLMLALLITAPILWLVERSSRPKPWSGPPQMPPGWYPDPFRIGGVRFWDGRTWTPAVA